MPPLITNPDRKEQVKQSILDAFQEIAYPADERVALQPETFDGAAIEKAFKGHHWRDVPREAVNRHVMVFLRPEARHFYMPAFLLASLDRLPDGAVDLDLYSLKPPEDKTRFRQEYDPYTSAQREAIRLFLEYARDEVSSPDSKAAARLALERYWARDARNSQGTAQGAPGTKTERTNLERVTQVIREAFAEVPYPGDEAIAYKPDDWEGKDINLDFAGYHWRELSHAVVSYHYSALSFFSATGMQFYLPAYLMASLEGDGNILGCVMHALRPSKDHREEYFESPEASFTPDQRRAIRVFLEYVRDEAPASDGEKEARQMLEDYWGKDGPET